MSPRKRSKNRPNVPNLTVNERGTDTYYGWKDPRTGKESSLKAKNDRKAAIERAQKLNAIVAKEMADTFIERFLAKNK